MYHFYNNHFVYIDEGVEDVESRGRNVRCFLATTVGYQPENTLWAELEREEASVRVHIYR